MLATDEEPPKRLSLVAGLIVGLLVIYYLVGTSTAQINSEGLNGLFLEPVSAHYLDYYVFNQELIDCLIKYESRGNPEAVGDHGTSFGILQFKERTFQGYCVEYGYSEDIWDPEIQKLCCGEMIYKNPNNVFHWTTYKFCKGLIKVDN